MSALAVLSADDLRSLVREEVRVAVASALQQKFSVQRDVLSRQQAADMIGVDPHEMPRLIRRGLPVHFVTKRGQRFFRAEVLEWLAGQNGCE